MKDNSGKILLAMLAGASAGVIAGLLMAPDTGEVTRSSVKKWAGKMSKDLEKNLQQGLDEIKKMSGDTFGKSGQEGKDSTTASQGAGSTAGTSATTGAGSATTNTTTGGSTSGSTTGSTTGRTGGTV